MFLPLPEALDIRMSSRGHHHETLGRVLEDQHPKFPGVVTQELEVYLGQELVVEDAWEGAETECKGQGEQIYLFI